MEFYFVSDLHIGGDGSLGECDFESELIAFLELLVERAEKQGAAIELILLGDTFALWEISEVHGSQAIEQIAEELPALFEQFRRTGERVKITVTPGNHDHDLATEAGYREALAGYNLNLDPSYAITRTCAGRTIWIEHGNQHDSFNAFEPWDDPHVHPVGYYITQKLVRTAALRSSLGRRDWVGDVEAVNPSENVLNWLISNYFYREMNPLLRWIALPFLLFSSLSLLILLGTLLESFSLLPTTLFLDRWLYRPPVIGEALRYFITINMSVLVVVMLAAIPIWIVIRDFRKTLDRYELRFTRRRRLQKDARYLKGAEAVFKQHPECVLFIYGHTHTPSLTRIDARAVINTGTWLKRLTRLRSRWTLVPDIYYPSFRIGYFRVYEQDGDVVVERTAIPKKTPNELTFVQRVLTWRKNTRDDVPIPPRTVLPGGRSDSLTPTRL